MRKFGPVNVITYYPKTAEGKEKLARRVAEAHADAVTQIIKRQKCPNAQKLALLDAVIADTKAMIKQREESGPEKLAERDGGYR